MSKRRGSDSEPRFLVIGQVTKPHGVRGEVRAMPHTDLPERFKWLEVVYLGDGDDMQPIEVQNVRMQKNWIILKLAGYDSRNDAETIRGQLLQVPEDQAIPLQENEYFLYQLIGLAVATESGEELGELVEVIETGANNVFLLKGERGDILIPDIPEVIIHIDFDNGRMIVNPLPGLLNA